jgi:hypothetical protein
MIFSRRGLAQLQGAAFGLAAVLVGLGPVRLEVLAGGALAQHAVAAGATLEVNLLRRFPSRRPSGVGAASCANALPMAPAMADTANIPSNFLFILLSF